MTMLVHEEARPGTAVDPTEVDVKGAASSTLPPDRRRWQRTLIVVAIVAIAWWAYAFAVLLERPGVGSATGYNGWADQLNYRREAVALAHGELPGSKWDYDRQAPRPGVTIAPGETLSDYAYGLGYPILGVPFVWLGMEDDPFVIPDAAMFAATCVLIVVLGRRLRSTAFGLVAAGAVALATPTLWYFTVPWNNSVTIVSVLGAFALATSPRRPTWRHGLVLGLLTGWCFAARYLDVIWPPLIVGIAWLAQRRRHAVKPLAVAATVVLMIAVLVGYSHDRVFGSPFDTPYKHHVLFNGQSQDLSTFRPRQIPRTALQQFVNAEVDGQRPPVDPLARQAPWLIAAPIGVWLLRRRRHHLARVSTLMLAVSIAGTLVYLSMTAATGADLINHSQRYWIAWFPIWGLLALIAAAEGISWIVRHVPDEAPMERDSTPRSGT